MSKHIIDMAEHRRALALQLEENIRRRCRECGETGCTQEYCSLAMAGFHRDNVPPEDDEYGEDEDFNPDDYRTVEPLTPDPKMSVKDIVEEQGHGFFEAKCHFTLDDKGKFTGFMIIPTSGMRA